MTITPEFLQSQIAEAEQRKARLLADLNAAIGELRMLQSLLAEAEKPEEAPEPPEA